MESLNLSEKVSLDLHEIMERRKIADERVERISDLYLGGRESICPKFIFLGEKNSSEWMRLKDALSSTAEIHVHFFCEAEYNGCRRHAVRDQQGIDISKMKDWAKKITPWLKVSLAILWITATATTDSVAPGVGVIIPNFVDWQQTSTLAKGIVLATGFTAEELDKLARSDGVDSKAFTSKNKQKVWGANKKIMMELLGRSTPQEFEEKLGLRKVYLKKQDGSSRRAFWICHDCFEKYQAASLVTDIHE